ncbi:peptidoglycan editing factor PgeF [Clostridium sediminicola]|uniref:peptidoglycan editing factor PgeF n=1 Tax=Clostridium sediminicola TaxID=3114879 RepID=UPI0031F241CC
MFEKFDCEFFDFKHENIEVYFSTAKNNISYNRNTKEGQENIDNLKSYFCVKNVGYCKQIHSNDVIIFDNKIVEGDALITDKKDIAIGVFTADCVPIIILDKRKKVVAAVHSGWKGTYKDIIIKTVHNMIEKYQCNISDLLFYIGPHNMDCCYEVSEELIEKFKDKQCFFDKSINNGRFLSLQKCIILQLESIGVHKKNIFSINKCTFCNEEYSLHSYRKQSDNYGRMFSFVIIR